MIPNQAPDSSVAGYLQPGRTDDFALDQPPGLDQGVFELPNLEGPLLDDYLQQFVAGISGLDGTLVRPRWQPEPPNIPDFGTTWASLGIMRRRSLGFVGATLHDPAGNGHSIMLRHEQLEILISFYGPQCDEAAGNLHDGLMLEQNRIVLRSMNMGLVEITDGISNPELIKERWLDRVDKTLFINRCIAREYPVLNQLTASGTVIPDPGGGYQAPFTVNPP
jgi:hypothetical protein